MIRFRISPLAKRAVISFLTCAEPELPGSEMSLSVTSLIFAPSEPRPTSSTSHTPTTTHFDRRPETNPARPANTSCDPIRAASRFLDPFGQGAQRPDSGPEQVLAAPRRHEAWLRREEVRRLALDRHLVRPLAVPDQEVLVVREAEGVAVVHPRALDE